MKAESGKPSRAIAFANFAKKSAHASRHSGFRKPPSFIIPFVFIQAGGLHGEPRIQSGRPAAFRAAATSGRIASR